MRQSLAELEGAKQTGRTRPTDERGRRIKLAVALVAVSASGVLLYNHFAGPTLVPGQTVPMEVAGTETAAAAPSPAGVPSSPSNTAATGQPTLGLPATSTSSTPPAPIHLPRPAGPTMVPNG